jgi:hypothetical protein
MWTPRHVIGIAVPGLLAALLLICWVSQVSRDLALWLTLVVLVGLGVVAILAVVRWFRAPYFREVAPTAGGLFPVLTTQRGEQLVVVNPNAAPGPTARVQPDGRVDLGGEFDPGHLLAASREARIVQATTALSQPGAPLDGRLAAARLASSAAPADDLPPVRVSTVAPEHVRRLLIEAGEVEEQPGQARRGRTW